MADFIISPYAISYNSIKNALKNYINDKSDVTGTWKDFYASGAGETILELDAAVAAFYAFHFIMGRRESYLTVAQNYNSIVGGALSLGYNCSRGHNVYVEFEIIPQKTQTLSKWDIVGSYAEYDIVLLEDAILNANQPTTIKCIIGNVAAQQIRVKDVDEIEKLQQFVFTAANSTDDCRLILNDTIVPHSTELKDAMDDKYIMLTNSFGAVDVFYLNNGNYKYTAGDILYFQYIERNNLNFGGLSKSSVVIDVAKQIDNMYSIQDRTEKEDGEHIRMSAPLYHETNNVVRARKDYVKYLKQNNPNIIDANDKDINPGLIALTYLKADNQDGTALLTTEEKQNYVKCIMDMCPDGVATAFIEDPVRVVRALDIEVKQKANENIPATFQDEVEAILDTYRNKLKVTLDFDQIEHDIEQLKGVKTARVSLGSTPYQNNQKYKLYDVITTPELQVGDQIQTWTMYCAKVQSKTGDSEPDWAAASNVGDRIDDNNFIWENSNKYAPAISAIWKKDGSYELYSDINTSYTIQPKCTLSTQPKWGFNGGVKDGNVTWNYQKEYDLLPIRENNTKYNVGDLVLFDFPQNRAIYKVESVKHLSGRYQPNWPTEMDIKCQDNALSWQKRYNLWKPLYRHNVAEFIGAVVDNKLLIYKSQPIIWDIDLDTQNRLDTYHEGANGQTGSAMPTFGPDEVIDDTIKWILEETIENYTDWTSLTEIPNGTYTSGTYGYYQVCGTEHTITGGDIENLEEDIEDNNIVWKLQTYDVNDKITDLQCIGGYWRPSTQYEVDDVIIVNSDKTYIYKVSAVNDQETEEENVIYSVVGYAGTTSSTEPAWGEDNVVDNDILWTKTKNLSDVSWQANTVKHHGDIIKTSQGNYVFSSVLGTSGDTDPDWLGITNNKVQDNNITWVKISSSNSMALQWNEYLDLKIHNLEVV